MFNSCWYSSCSRLYESSLLNRNLIAACLWCVGWLEARGIMVSVNVGFLYMAGSLYVCWGSVHGDVKVVEDVVFFGFCCEL